MRILHGAGVVTAMKPREEISYLDGIWMQVVESMADLRSDSAVQYSRLEEVAP